ncbi:hypothetical protein GCM10008957_36640 [Deinococcus ruber]|uniref:Tetratricopeptide repeat protein n=2 Tax=Deinococcus ruber TaxID=1848197 RepID=A0A918CEW2_9DEIO|nr:hypothetical protein GCM10008957_36640 [Deinococcus ruber]
MINLLLPRNFRTALLLLVSAAMSVALASPPSLPRPASLPDPAFPFGSAAFRDVAQTSYRTVGLSGSFDAWLSAAYDASGVPLGSGTGNLAAALDARAAILQASSGDARIKLERDTAAWAHRFIKKAIPKFSLERGFELANVVENGERQCLAQSFIITGLLQRAGLQAGIVMVWANPAGKESNLGHMVTTVRLSNGTDLMVDASDPAPFVHHQGLLVKHGSVYSFVRPTYSADDSISGYRLADRDTSLSVNATAPLTLTYIRSQFDYYRGERAIGGVLGTGVGKATPAGLQQSAAYLTRAIQDDPQNALATFVLGHVLARQGLRAQAKQQYQKAAVLYAREGHVPAGVAQAITALTQAAGNS